MTETAQTAKQTNSTVTESDPFYKVQVLVTKELWNRVKIRGIRESASPSVVACKAIEKYLKSVGEQ